MGLGVSWVVAQAEALAAGGGGVRCHLEGV
jgi:N-dimethylarginine dimethylaminohydrolase